MNSDFSKLSKEERDLRITALILGELSTDEAEEVHQAIAADAQLAREYEQRKQTIELVRETTAIDRKVSTDGTPLKMDDERRQKLLESFKTPAPVAVPSQAQPRRPRNLWYVPMSIAAVLVGLLVIVATQESFQGARRMARVTTLRASRTEAEFASQSASPKVLWAFDTHDAQPARLPDRPINGAKDSSPADARITSGLRDRMSEGELTEALMKTVPSRAVALPAIADTDGDTRIQISGQMRSLTDLDAKRFDEQSIRREINIASKLPVASTPSAAKNLFPPAPAAQPVAPVTIESMHVAESPVAAVNRQQAGESFTFNFSDTADAAHLRNQDVGAPLELNIAGPLGLPATAAKPFAAAGDSVKEEASRTDNNRFIARYAYIADARAADQPQAEIDLWNRPAVTAAAISGKGYKVQLPAVDYSISAQGLEEWKANLAPPATVSSRQPETSAPLVHAKTSPSAEGLFGNFKSDDALTDLAKGLHSDLSAIRQMPTGAGGGTTTGLGASFYGGVTTAPGPARPQDSFGVEVYDTGVKADGSVWYVNGAEGQREMRSTNGWAAVDYISDAGAAVSVTNALPNVSTFYLKAQFANVFPVGTNLFAGATANFGDQSFVSNSSLQQSAERESGRGGGGGRGGQGAFGSRLSTAVQRANGATGTTRGFYDDDFAGLPISDPNKTVGDVNGRVTVELPGQANVTQLDRESSPTRPDHYAAADVPGLPNTPVETRKQEKTDVQGPAPQPQTSVPQRPPPQELEQLAQARKPAAPAATPQPEIQTRDNAFSTFSLNVADVSFKLAAASLEKGAMPDVASIRSEEFLNAFDYRDPMPAPGVPIAFAWERTRYPFAHNRDVLRFSIKTAAQGRESGKPLNVVLCLDNSGSMERADRVRIIQESLRSLAAQLKPQDKLSVVAFSRTARLWVDGVSGTQAVEVAKQIGALTPEGGTNLEDALDLAYRTALRHYAATAVNRVVLLTDGAANLGNVEPKSLKSKVESFRKQGVALDCFGIGWEGFNDDLLEQLSRNGDGRYGFVNTPEEATTEFVGQLAGALRVAASDVKVQVEFNPKRVTAYRQVGYAKHQLTKQQFRDNTVDAAEIGAAEAGNGLYIVETNPRGEGPIATVRARFRIPQTRDYREHEWVVPFGSSVELEQSSSAMRLAASASAFSEWLAGSPFTGEVTTDRLLGILSGVPEIYGADTRPKKLEWMIRQAKSISGK